MKRIVLLALAMGLFVSCASSEQAVKPRDGDTVAKNAQQQEKQVDTKLYDHKTLSPVESAELLDEYADADNFTLLDVRTPEEFASGHLDGAVNIDYYAADFRTQLASLDTDDTYLIYCRSGNRSGAALSIFSTMGFEEVYDIAGGIGAWNAYCVAESSKFCMQ